MLDQSFSTANFKRILDSENRKGNYLEKIFFPELNEYSNKIRRTNLLVRKLRKSIIYLESKNLSSPVATIPALESSIEAKRGRISKLKEYVKKTKSTKMEHLDNLLEVLVLKVSKNKINTKLKKKVLASGKIAYISNNDAETYLPLKQVQSNLKKVFSIKPKSRSIIIKQLKQSLDKSYPKIFYKTDIESFYESIDRELLLSVIDKNNLISTQSKNIIKELLNNYENLSGNKKGIPRGVGISPFLAEIYLSYFDNKIGNHPEVIFYCRYVDDIVILFDNLEPTKNNIEFFKNIIKDEFEEIYLKANESKTACFPYKNKPKDFEYLGYLFSHNKNEKLTLDIGIKRKTAIECKIVSSINFYKKNYMKNEKLQRKLLSERLKFLTGNFHLLNNKRNAMVGIYFSNELADETKTLKNLDKLLRKQLATIKNHYAKTTLIKKYSFLEGFRNRTFYNFSTQMLKNITRIWK